MPSSPDAAGSDHDLFGMLKEKLKNYIERAFDEHKQEGHSILRSIPGAELFSVFQTWLRR
jgi:hypothetical protein